MGVIPIAIGSQFKKIENRNLFEQEKRQIPQFDIRHLPN